MPAPLSSPDHDLLIRIDERTETIFQELKKMNARICESEGAIQHLEVYGAQISRDNAAELVLVTDRVEKIEKNCAVERVEKQTDARWYDSLWVRVPVIFGAFSGLVMLAINLYNFLKNNI
jgi:hypothetical protein